MKKRVLMLALVVGLVMSFVASAMAADRYEISEVLAEYKAIHKVEQRVGNTFRIRVRANIYNATKAYGGSSEQVTSCPEATDLHWELEQIPATEDSRPVSIDLAIDPEEEPLSTDSAVYSAVLTGTIMRPGTVRVTAQLWNGKQKIADNIKAKKSADVIFTIENKGDEKIEDKDGSLFPTDDETPAVFDGLDPYGDPDSSTTWNGKNAEPNNTCPWGTGIADKKGGKPALKTSKLSFKAGEYESKTIEIQGAGTKITGIYIAPKDAIKLGWLQKGATGKIYLTKENIKSWDIPFRITGYDMNASSTDKNAKSTLTLAFNGAKVAYKGFPLTIEMTNSNTASKPVVKAVKIDVTPTTGVPKWLYDGYVNIVDSYDRSVAPSETVGISADQTITYKDADGITWTVTSVDLENCEVADDGKTVKVKATASGAIEVKHSRTVKTPTQLEVTKKTAKEDPDALEVVAAVGDSVEANDKGQITPKTFYVDGELIAPYTVEWKDPKDKGISITYTKPVLDSYGNVFKHGKVTISGKLTEVAKETKNAITFTAVNKSTGKKAALKVTVIGKLAPYFDTSKWEENGTLMPTKRVEAGKVPSVAFKAKGSKTITYELDDEDGKIAAALVKCNLSFDKAKGKVIANGRGARSLPTIDEETDEFDPIVLEVLAVNSVGSADAKALVGVTGAKVKADKATPEFTVGAPKGTTGTPVPMKGVTPTTEGYKVKFGQNAKDAKGKDITPQLSAYGLGIVDTWSTPDTILGNVDTLISSMTDETLPESYLIVKITSSTNEETGEVETEETIITDQSKYVANLLDKDGETVIGKKVVSTLPNDSDIGTIYVRVSGDVNNTDHLPGPNKNQLVLEVTDNTKLKNGLKKDKAGSVTFKISADNYGAETILSVKVTFKPAGSTSSPVKAKKNTLEEVTKVKNGKGGGDAYKFYYDVADQPEADDETKDETEETVVIGEARTVAQLTAGQSEFLAGKGYKVVAVLPEITAKVDGQQEFEVELDEEAPEGAKLIWIAFPQNAEETEDDRIADFYDAEEGLPIEDVPAGKVIVVSPWLREDVTYQPVIAVEE